MRESGADGALAHSGDPAAVPGGLGAPAEPPAGPAIDGVPAGNDAGAALTSLENESLESLEAKHAEYLESLASIQETLEVSEEPELLKLAADIQELVSLYADLVALKRAERGGEAGAGAAATPASAASGDAARPAAAAQLAPGRAEGGKLSLRKLLSRSCYAKYDGEWYVAVVTDVHEAQEAEGGARKSVAGVAGVAGAPAPGAASGAAIGANLQYYLDESRVTVTYVGWGNSESLPVNDVKFLPALTDLPPSAPCWAVDAADGLWYRATTVGPPSPEHGGYTVRFKKSGETAAVPFDQVSAKLPLLCVAEPGAAAGAAAAGAGNTHAAPAPPPEIVTPAGYRIPQRLVIQPGDPEKVRASKRRKILLLKREQKKELDEKKARERAANWRMHAQVRGGGARASIFATADGPRGRGGVALPPGHDHRARHSFAHLAAAASLRQAGEISD